MIEARRAVIPGNVVSILDEATGSRDVVAGEVIQRFRPGVRNGVGQAVTIALPQLDLKRVVIRVKTFALAYIIEGRPGNGTRVSMGWKLGSVGATGIASICLRGVE